MDFGRASDRVTRFVPVVSCCGQFVAAHHATCGRSAAFADLGRMMQAASLCARRVLTHRKKRDFKPKGPGTLLASQPPCPAPPGEFW
jgi:hypothetical protein